MKRLVVLFSCGLLLGCGQQPGTRSTTIASLDHAEGNSAAEAMQVTDHAEGNSAAEAMQVTFNIDGAPTIEFEVPGMMCPHGCVPKVHEAFAEQPGVKDVQVVYATKTAVVAIDEELFNASDAIAVLEDEFGFSGTRLKNADSPSIDESQPAGAPNQAG